MSSFYVFYVNGCSLVALDKDVASKSVRNLQRAIRDATGIAVKEQLLLTYTGGEMELDKRVSNYENSGTMAKPIYLFYKPAKTEKDDMSNSFREDVSKDISIVIESGTQILRMNDEASMYLKLSEHSRAVARVAESTVNATATIVQEHHHLNGGWNALLSNIKEGVLKLEQKQTKLDAQINKLGDIKEKTKELTSGFEECLEMLKTVDMPASLRNSTGYATLYDWIESCDTQYSMKELLDQVKDQILVVDMSEVDMARGDLRVLSEMVDRPENKEIRGYNRRISQIEHILDTINHTKEEIFLHCRSIRQDNPKMMDKDVQSAMMDKQSMLVKSMHDKLRNISHNAGLLQKSKGELMEHVRSRLYGWVLTAGRKMYLVRTSLIVFDEKFRGLRKRLDVVRQVKETPLMFATCINEIIRRKQLQKDFRQWHQAHTERCHRFTGEENQLRTVFAAKLENHFLRVIFQSMFDKLPVFFVKHVPEFDSQLPDIDAEYYMDLRKNAGPWESVLQVCPPQVKERLAGGRPTSLVSVQSQPTLRREVSFPHNNDLSNLTMNLQNCFPSNSWLSGQDADLDMSPVPGSSMPSTPVCFIAGSSSEERRSNPFQDQRRLPSLHDIHEADYGVSHSLKSAPICIPSASRSMREEQPERLSNCSSNDDDPLSDSKEEREQFAIDDISTRSQMMEVLRPMSDELKALKKEMEETKGNLDVYGGWLKGHSEDITDKITAHHLLIVEQIRIEHDREMEAERAKTAALENHMDMLSSQMALQEGTIETLRQAAAAKDRNIEELEKEMAAADGRLKEATDEIYKKLIIEYELAKDREASDFREIIEEKEDVIRQLKAAAVKSGEAIATLKKGTEAEEYKQMIEADIRGNMEKEFKARIDYITKGLEQKLIARLRKDLEYDQKKKDGDKDLAHQLTCYERDLLRSLADSEQLEDIAKSVQSQKQKIQEANSSPFSSITSPRVTPRKPHPSFTSMSGSFSLSYNSESPANDFVLSPSSTALLAISPTSDDCVLPKMFAHGDLTPGSDEKNVLRPMTSRIEESAQEDSATSGEERVDEEGGNGTRMKKSNFMEESFTYNTTRVVDKSDERMEAMMESSTEGLQKSVSVQTKICSRAMELMVSLNDIREGATVLVVWDERHNSYIIFCISNFLHFVKKTGVRRLGIDSSSPDAPAGAVRKNWVLARVSHVDLCVIKKSSNRYMLPVDTQVYRVDVRPLTLDTTGHASVPPPVGPKTTRSPN